MQAGPLKIKEVPMAASNAFMCGARRLVLPKPNYFTWPIAPVNRMKLSKE
jgi:hypothetical protein